MSPLDPIFTTQFAWADELDPSALMTDPEAGARVAASYVDDPTYEFPDVPVRDELIDGPLGTASLPVRVYGAGDGTRPALVWAHGGGFIAGDLDGIEADGVSRELAHRAGAVVVSVGYHLAGSEFSYPTLHREVSSAVDWVLDNATSLGVDANAVTVGGASAGANLALGAVLERRDAGMPVPNQLLLVYPALLDASPEGFDAPDMAGVPNLLRISPEMNAYMFMAYRGAHAGEAPYTTFLGHDLADIPRTLVLTAEYDDLRPGADAFAAAAVAAGAPIEAVQVSGSAHGFLAMTPRVAVTESSLTRIADFVNTVA